ncbi:unnamed protein product [Cuscuta europaea]|uniref:Reverse transcriptase RNase H-like domain-containing protein n=1 Tax=Cuscuta europaea TaxID=41803 RepID=A0A9P1E4V2_CUSEU|nr:unnamed protein product [Cuscuta europaea]
MEGVGAVLMQEGYPIAYFSKGFSKSNRFKSTYDRELLALILALQKWRHYLLGRHFTVQTDHCSLKHLLDQKVLTNSQHRLLIKILPFDFTITYKSGKDNSAADALSRHPQLAEFFQLVVPMVNNISQLPLALKEDPETRALIEKMQRDPESTPNYSLASGRLYYKSRLVIPNQEELRSKLIEEAHGTPTEGHGGYLKTLKRLGAHLYWKGMKHDVMRFIQRCAV